MIRTVKLTDEAKADIRRLVHFLAERAPEAAERLSRTLRKATSSLDRLAERGRPSQVEGYRELVIKFGRSAYIARYRIDGAQVLITRIHHRYEDRSR